MQLELKSLLEKQATTLYTHSSSLISVVIVVCVWRTKDNFQSQFQPHCRILELNSMARFRQQMLLPAEPSANE